MQRSRDINDKGMKIITIRLATGSKQFKLIALREMDSNTKFVVYKDGEGYTIAWLTAQDCFVNSRFTFLLDDAMDIFNNTIAQYYRERERQLINAACDKH